MTFIENLALKLDIPSSEVESLLYTAPKRYKVYQIPKRTHGYRTIAQPSRDLKKCQRAFLDMYQLPCNKASMAYVQGKSIKENALAHSRNAYLLKLDLANFFNSLTPAIFWQAWQYAGMVLLKDDDKQWIENLLFWHTNNQLVLSIGAPSSPSVSNFCMQAFDEQVIALCKQQKVIYTRYADDLTFSTNQKDVLFGFPKQVEQMLVQIFAGVLIINKGKTVFSSRAHNRHVTGITITNGGKISLGRKRKRYIKHLVYRFGLGQLDEDETAHLKGLLAFARHIELRFFKLLEDKYTKPLIDKIFKGK